MSCDFLPLLHMKQRFADAGLNVAVIESSPPMDRIKLGLPGRDEEIDRVCELLTNMGVVGIPVWCYNFMAVFGWLRTSTSVVGRGGALVSGYDHELMEKAPLTEAGVVSEERLWDNFAYFLERVVPVAEQAGVLLAQPLRAQDEVGGAEGGAVVVEVFLRVRVPPRAGRGTAGHVGHRLVAGGRHRVLAGREAHAARSRPRRYHQEPPTSMRVLMTSGVMTGPTQVTGMRKYTSRSVRRAGQPVSTRSQR